MLRAWKTRSKLLVLIAVMAAGSTTVGAIGLILFGRLERETIRVSGAVVPGLASLAEIENSVAIQQNAASAEESAAAASELSGQAEELASMVATFQLSKGARSTGTRSNVAGPGKVHALVRSG